MRDFKQQLKAYGDEMKNSRCPYSEAELDKEIRSVIWDVLPDEKKNEKALYPKIFNFQLSTFNFVKYAAILAVIIIPTAIFTSKSSKAGVIASVKVDGEHVYFACNNGCSADATIETFKTLLR